MYFLFVPIIILLSIIFHMRSDNFVAIFIALFIGCGIGNVVIQFYTPSCVLDGWEIGAFDVFADSVLFPFFMGALAGISIGFITWVPFMLYREKKQSQH